MCQKKRKYYLLIMHIRKYIDKYTYTHIHTQTHTRVMRIDNIKKKRFIKIMNRRTGFLQIYYVLYTGISEKYIIFYILDKFVNKLEDLVILYFFYNFL